MLWRSAVLPQEILTTCKCVRFKTCLAWEELLRNVRECCSCIVAYWVYLPADQTSLNRDWFCGAKSNLRFISTCLQKASGEVCPKIGFYIDSKGTDLKGVPLDSSYIYSGSDVIGLQCPEHGLLRRFNGCVLWS